MAQHAVIDLFAGVGGLSYGFSQSDNFKVVLANEYDSDTAKAYKLNHPQTTVFDCDISLIDQQTILPFLKTPISVVVGGPPCQSYSTLGKRRNDDKAQLFKEYCRLLKIINPQIFIFENVTGILSMLGGELFKSVKKAFEDIGYSVKHAVLNAVSFGVPQIRERVILVGTRKENSFQFPKSTHGDGGYLKPLITMRDALGDMPKLKSGEKSSQYATGPQNDFQKFIRGGNMSLTENASPDNGEHLKKIMQALPDGGTKYDLPEELRPKSGYGNTYAKLWWNRPVPTVTRNFACVSSSRCVHPRDSRALTTREGARLQSFPDSYQFYGSRQKKNLQIGNAVPPLLSIQLAKQVLSYLKNLGADDV